MMGDIREMVDDYFKAKNLKVEEYEWMGKLYHKLIKLNPTPAKPNSPTIQKKKLTSPPASP